MDLCHGVLGATQHRDKATKLANLDKVWEALNEIRDEGGRDYSLAEVGRRLEKVGGPKTQSLRNAQGAAYRNIIATYANAVSGATRYEMVLSTHCSRSPTIHKAVPSEYENCTQYP
nr:gamma-mobile-trio protein GmtX [Simplicispira suum]